MKTKTLRYVCFNCGTLVAEFDAERNQTVTSVCDKPACRKIAHERYMLGVKR